MTETWIQMTDRHQQERHNALSDLADRGLDMLEASEILGIGYHRLSCMAKNQGVKFIRQRFMGINGMAKKAAFRFDKLTDSQQVDYGTFMDAGYCVAAALKAIGRSDLVGVPT